MRCIVIVPVYREMKNNLERQSFSSTCQLCAHEDIAKLCIICHKKVNLSEYRQAVTEYGIKLDIKYFPFNYFSDIYGYNRLMLSYDFYRSFSNYDYMLICQLDAIIFKHELKVWCSKNYDYIGAPIFAPGYSGTDTYATTGNGGLSLRKIQTFLNILDNRKPLPVRELFTFKREYNPKFTLRKRIMYFLMLWSLGRASKVFLFLSRWVAEDLFFSFTLQGTSKQPVTPPVAESVLFSFDLNHPFWYRYTNNTIPFGVHRWNISNSHFWQDIVHI